MRGGLDHRADARRIVGAVAVKQQEVGCLHDVRGGRRTASVTGAYQQTAPVAPHTLDQFDQLVHARRLQDLVVVRLDVTLVVHLHEHVAVVAVQQPVGGVDDRAPDSRFVLHALVLPEVEVAHDGHHPEFGGAIEDGARRFM